MSLRWVAGLVWATGVVPALAAQQAPAAQERAARLVFEQNGAPIGGGVELKPSDSLVLTVRAVDSLGNSVPLSGFEIWVWDPGVIGVVAQEVGASAAVVHFQSRRRGVTTIQFRASGVRDWVRVQLTETVLTFSPGQNAPPGVEPGRPAWTVGGRLSGGLYRFSFNNTTIFKGNFGFVAEGYGGLEFPSGLELVGGLGLGLLSADSLGTTVHPNLIEGYVRADYVLSRQQKLRPVVSGGVGLYRVRTGPDGSGIWNTSFEFLVGGGVDITVGPTTVAELRLSTQQMFEMNSSHVNGYVGSLWLIGGGLRVRL
jgi:hypothetical protein